MICCNDVAELISVAQCQQSHRYCRTCHATHLTAALAEQRGTPLTCMSQRCTAQYSHADALRLLSASDVARFVALERRWKAGDKLRFCARPNCGHEHTQVNAGEPRFVCTRCGAANCAVCRTLWHSGLTCAKFQALPEQMRSPEDAHLLKLAQKNGWRQCPRCKNMVDKNLDDCKFVKCKCGCGFCFDCGEPYKSLVGTETNEHGEPSCQCGLWSDAFDADRVLEELDSHDLGSPEYIAVVSQAVARRLVSYRDVLDEENDSDEDDDGHKPTQPLFCLEAMRRGDLVEADIADDLNDAFTHTVVNSVLGLKCWVCARQFASIATLTQHINGVSRHPVYACCGIVFKDERELADHRSRRAGDVARDRLPAAAARHEPRADFDLWNGLEVACCGALDEEYGRVARDDDADDADCDDDERERRRNLRRRRQRRDERDQLRIASSLLSGKCPVCLKTFNGAEGAFKHLSSTSAHAAYLCCSRFFGSAAALGRHWRRVELENQVCRSCGRIHAHDDGGGDDDDDDDDEYDDGEYDDGEYDEDEDGYDDDEDDDDDGDEYDDGDYDDGEYDDEYNHDDEVYRAQFDALRSMLGPGATYADVERVITSVMKNGGIADLYGDDNYDDDEEADEEDDEEDEDDYGEDDHFDEFDLSTVASWPANAVKRAVLAKQCPYCVRQFNNMTALAAHLDETRQHAVYACCNRLFSDERALVAHQEN